MEREAKRGKQELECLQAVLKLIPQSSSIYQYLSSAKPNSDASVFPDFVFEGGFIEHFQVTSANEIRKGDENRVAEAIFEKESEEEFENKKQEFLNSQPSPNTIYTNVLGMEAPKYSYDNFIKSFKRNFEHHIESLDKYGRDKTIGIFLVEHAGSKITVLRNGKFLVFYKIRLDRDLLSYLYQFKDKLKYLIYFMGDEYEVIELSKIEDMISRVPNDISFGAGRFIYHNISMFIDL